MESEEGNSEFQVNPWENDDYGSLKMSMADLKHFITKSMVETSKLDACFDIFLVELRDNRGESLHELLNFSEYNNQSKNKLQNAAGTLRKNIDSLLPGFLNLSTESNILEDQKLKQKLHDRVDRLASGNRSRNNSEFGKQSYYASQKSLLDTLVSRCFRQSSHGGDKSEPAPLSQTAFEKSCQELGQLISGEKASATFACGGAVSIGDNLPPGIHDVSSPVRISWTAKDGSCEYQVALPIIGGSPLGAEKLAQLISDCEVASFGKGEKDIVDPTYRKAGKIDPSRFLSSFHPADLKILDDIEQLLVPNFNSLRENQLPFRRLKAELYKLNVYSGPDGHFQKHVDTPRSKTQTGSLVVCLPSAFKGGRLIVRHHGNVVNFDWSARSDSAIQWAAFYSECEHEIQAVTEGHRVTLKYNLFVTDSGCGSLPRNVNLDPRTLPLYQLLRDLLAEPGFMKEGGIVGVHCSHAYPHASSQAQELLPRGLKGADLAVYSVFKSFGIDAHVLPVLRQKHDELMEEGAVEDMLKFLRDGEEFEPEFAQVPQILPVEPDLEKYWKMLYVSRRLYGTGKINPICQRKGVGNGPRDFPR